jgi:hypothetical protein
LPGLKTEKSRSQSRDYFETSNNFTLAELKAETHPDEWEEVKGDPAALQAFALALQESRQAEDLREAYSERAAILEYEGGLERAEAELEAAKMTVTLARNRRYTWGALDAALGRRWNMPDRPEPVDSLVLGVARFAVLPEGRVVRQGLFRQPVESAQTPVAAWGSLSEFSGEPDWTG